MDLTYKIRVFNESTGSIVVEFQDFAPFNIDLPLVDGKYPEGQALDEFIRGFLPIEFVQRKQIISQGIENASNIAALVEPWPTPEPTTNGTPTS
jgi:hypothetical protein